MRSVEMPTPPLAEAEIVERLTNLPGWQRDGDKIVKTFKLKNYAAGLVFACAVGSVAEGMDHHPEMTIGWRKVTISYTTHDAGNKLSHKDFAAAEAIEKLPYPGGE
jgi:4a-hydroxytetrahydrobiopterin dehydratase